MASAVYPKYKQKLISGGSNVNLSSGTVVAKLIDTGTYTYSTSHEFVSDLSGVLATSSGLSSKAVTNGLFDAADVTFTGVSGATGEAIILAVDTGSAGTSSLVAYIDGLSFTPDGNDITVAWNASGIFQL